MTQTDDEIEFAVVVWPEYSIESIDNFIDGGEGVPIFPDVADQLREIRHDAFQAFKAKNFDLMMAHLRALHFACYFYGARPSAKIGERKRKQNSEFGRLGTKARTKYTEADKARWRSIAASPDVARLQSKRRRAEIIAHREGLPKKAIERIRKEI